MATLLLLLLLLLKGLAADQYPVNHGVGAWGEVPQEVQNGRLQVQPPPRHQQLSRGKKLL